MSIKHPGSTSTSTPPPSVCWTFVRSLLIPCTLEGTTSLHGQERERALSACLCAPHFLVRVVKFFPRAPSRLTSPYIPLAKATSLAHLHQHGRQQESLSSPPPRTSPHTALPSHFAVTSLSHSDPLVPVPFKSPHLPWVAPFLWKVNALSYLIFVTPWGRYFPFFYR